MRECPTCRYFEARLVLIPEKVVEVYSNRFIGDGTYAPKVIPRSVSWVCKSLECNE